MNFFKYIGLFSAAALFACSCSFMHDDQAVARVGKEVLYKSQLDKYIPMGLSKADSTALARKYIRSWASELIMNDMAQAQLSKAELDISKEVSDFKSSLLKYRYEQHYITDRLDTTVTREEIEAFYEKDAKMFTLNIPIAKARYLRLPVSCPMKESLKKLMASEDEDDLYMLDSLANISADKLSRYGDKWVDMVTIARDYGIDYGTLIASIDGNFIEIVDSQGLEHVTCLLSYIPSGKIPPLEYCADKIREVIVSKRKYVLSTNLEQDLLDNALEKGKFVIYENDEE